MPNLFSGLLTWTQVSRVPMQSDSHHNERSAASFHFPEGNVVYNKVEKYSVNTNDLNFGNVL
jgi:hypothetical protein